MERQEIGLVGLFAGKEVAATNYGISQEEVAQCMTEIRVDLTPALQYVRKSIVNFANEVGEATAAEKLEIPQKALRLIKQSVELELDDPDEDQDSPEETNEPLPRTEPEPFSEEGVIRKVLDMYDKGVKPRIISGLYNVPVGVVQCWGDWRQMSSDKASEMRLKQAKVIELREAGVCESEICQRLRVSINMLSYITGEFSPQPMYRSSQKSKYAAYCRLVRDCSKASEELGVPAKRLRKFMTDQGSDFETIQSDIEADKATKIRVLETFYSTGMDTTKTALLHDLKNPKLVATWVGEFMRSFRKPARCGRARKKIGVGNPLKICSWISEIEKVLWLDLTNEAMKSKALI
jgi:hypothetical protein